MKYAVVSALRAFSSRRLKRSIVHLAYNLSPSDFGAFAHVNCITPDMATGLHLLAQRGFAPRTIVDVGAYEGQWTRLAREIWPSSRTIMIEANRAKIPALQSLGETHCAVLGAEQGASVLFNVMETGSSVFAENSSVGRQEEMRKLATLDSLNLQIEPVGLLKIDTQGYELEVLKGAKRSLVSFEAVLLEVALVEMNEGAPLLEEVIDFMGNLDFAACDILEAHRRWRDKALVQIDVLFARADSQLLANRPFS